MKLKPLAFIKINNFNSLIHFMIICISYYQSALLTPTPNSGFTRRLYSVHAARPQRGHGALEDTTVLPQRAV